MEMAESKLVDVDNITLKREYTFFVSISRKASDPQARQSYISELEKEFNESDKNKNGRIDRKEFEHLIRGYFDLKGIKSTKENFDEYFKKVDIDHNQFVTFKEFIDFIDDVNENDILPFLSQEMEDRGLF